MKSSYYIERDHLPCSWGTLWNILREFRNLHGKEESLKILSLPYSAEELFSSMGKHFIGYSRSGKRYSALSRIFKHFPSAMCMCIWMCWFQLSQFCINRKHNYKLKLESICSGFFLETVGKTSRESLNLYLIKMRGKKWPIFLTC